MSWLPGGAARERLCAATGYRAEPTPGVSLVWLDRIDAGVGVEIFTVSRRLGHSDAAFTMNCYGHLVPGMQRTDARALALRSFTISWRTPRSSHWTRINSLGQRSSVHGSAGEATVHAGSMGAR